MGALGWNGVQSIQGTERRPAGLEWQGTAQAGWRETGRGQMALGLENHNKGFQGAAPSPSTCAFPSPDQETQWFQHPHLASRPQTNCNTLVHRSYSWARPHLAFKVSWVLHLYYPKPWNSLCGHGHLAFRLWPSCCLTSEHIQFHCCLTSEHIQFHHCSWRLFTHWVFSAPCTELRGNHSTRPSLWRNHVPVVCAPFLILLGNLGHAQVSLRLIHASTCLSRHLTSIFGWLFISVLLSAFQQLYPP